MSIKKKNHALNKRGKLSGRRWKIDFDYLDKLSDKDLSFLESFVQEEYGNNFNHEGKKLNKRQKDKKRIYSNTNSSERCILSLDKVKTTKMSRVTDLETYLDNILPVSDHENVVNDLLDSKKRRKRKKI